MGDFLAQIQAGKALKKVASPPERGPGYNPIPAPAGSGAPPAMDLMSQIKAKQSLRKVSDVAERPEPASAKTPSGGGGDLLSQLRAK